MSVHKCEMCSSVQLSTRSVFVVIFLCSNKLSMLSASNSSGFPYRSMSNPPSMTCRSMNRLSDLYSAAFGTEHPDLSDLDEGWSSFTPPPAPPPSVSTAYSDIIMTPKNTDGFELLR